MMGLWRTCKLVRVGDYWVERSLPLEPVVLCHRGLCLLWPDKMCMAAFTGSNIRITAWRFPVPKAIKVSTRYRYIDRVDDRHIDHKYAVEGCSLLVLPDAASAALSLGKSGTRWLTLDIERRTHEGRMGIITDLTLQPA